MKCNRTFVKEQNKVSLCSSFHVQGTVAQHGHTLRSYSQPVNSFNANRSLHPEVLQDQLSITSGPAFQHPALLKIKPQSGFFQKKNAR